MSATRRGIYHNLLESRYAISNKEVAFFFSSRLYRDKFLEGYEENRKEMNDKLGRWVDGKPLNMNTLADVSYYQMIEKRGFRVTLNGVELSWLSVYQYALRKMSVLNTLDWFVTPVLKLDGQEKTTVSI